MQGLDVDDVFAGVIDILPTESQLLRQTEVISSLLESVLAEYNLSATDLSTVRYLADDQGVDGFLDNNPVIIINGDVNIIVINPSTNLQTSLTSDLALDINLSLEDANPPSQPDKLRALPSKDSEIVLAWNASVDDIGVSQYDVLRDNVVIGMSAFPAFIDADVENGVSYTYSVIAIDAAENQSLKSESVTAALEADDIPPPTPIDVTLEPITDSIRINWDHQLISDVSSFEVLVDDVLLANTTSTFAYQANLLSGVEYCYQVWAVDGSGNKSPLSAVECAVTLQSDGTVLPAVEVVETVSNDPVIISLEGGTIVGAWGGVVLTDSGEIPVLIDLASDGDRGFDGSFEYPTLSG